MACLISFGGKEPQVAADAFIAPTAVLIGDVVVEKGASVWFGAVLRADFDRIVVGAGSSVQDNCVLHTNEDLPTIIGENVTVGRLSLLEGCVIEDGAIVGMGSIVLNRARVGRRALLAAGSVVPEDGEVPSGVLAAMVKEESQPFEIEELELEEPRAGEVFIPRLVELYTQGRFPLDRLIRSYPLEEVNQAAKDAEEGNTLKPGPRME